MNFVLFLCCDVITRQQSHRRRLGGQPKKLSSCCHLRCSTPFAGKAWDYLRLFTTVQQVSALTLSHPRSESCNQQCAAKDGDILREHEQLHLDWLALWRGTSYPASSSNDAGAKAFIDSSKLSFLTGMARPLGRPRKSTGWAALAAAPDGSFTTIFPDLPATSHMRSSVPFKAGDDPKAVTSTPGRETLTPARAAGNLPPNPVAAAPSKGTLASKAGTARSFPIQTRTRELHVPENQ